MYKVDNRPKKNQGRILALGIVIGIVIVIGGYFWFENTPNLIRMSGQIGNTINGVSAIAKTNPPQTTDLHSIALQIHNLVNNQRVNQNLPTLNWNEQIAQVAIIHSKDMATNNYFDHIDLSGKNPIQRLADNGINCNSYVGENIAAPEGYDSSQIASVVVNAWMGDEGHKANIINSGFTQEGIGLYQIKNQIYITEDFCGLSS